MISSRRKKKFCKKKFGEKNKRNFTSSSVSKHISRNIQILPYDQSLNSTELKTFESVVDSETVSASILANFVEILLNESLFLDEFDIGKGLCREFNGLMKGLKRSS